MTYEFDDMMVVGVDDEEIARKLADEAMEEALAAGYDPSKKPFMFEMGVEEEGKRPEA